MADQSDEGEVKFNLGLATLQRINELFYMYDEHMIKANLQKAKETLEIIYDEISFALKDEEKEEIEENELELTEFLEKLNIDGTYRAGNSLLFKYGRERKFVKEQLREFSRELRRLMKLRGMLMPQKGEEAMF